ncbi:MAG: hypothetical protein ACREBS_11090 [Nitrososphaerales archaeon]
MKITTPQKERVEKSLSALINRCARCGTEIRPAKTAYLKLNGKTDRFELTCEKCFEELEPSPN